MAAKELIAQVKLQVPAGSANPAPPVGPALGQHGLNIQDFCKQFNDRTKDNEKGLALPVIINVYKDRSFDFIIKSTPASILLKKAAGIQKGSATPQSNKVGKVTVKQLEDIVKQKEGDLNAADLEQAVKIIAYSQKHGYRGRIMRVTKRQKQINEKFELTKTYPILDAFNLLKETPSLKFNESIDISINLVWIPRNRIKTRGSTSLPHGIGKQAK